MLGIIGRNWPNELLILSDIVLFILLFYVVNLLAKRMQVKNA